jgi:hypothetical protein
MERGERRERGVSWLEELASTGERVDGDGDVGVVYGSQKWFRIRTLSIVALLQRYEA